MKQRILFVMNNLHVGGAEKALVSMLREFDYNRYQVDLLLFQQQGVFLQQLPKEVNLLAEPADFCVFDMPLSRAVRYIITKAKWKLLPIRFLQGLIYRTNLSSSRKEQYAWRFVSTVLPALSHYDVAIGYLQRTPIYFCVDKVKAKVKIGFIHNDYHQLNMDAALDKKYLAKVDHIFSVSVSCVDILKIVFPDLADRCKLMYNIISPSTLLALAQEPVALPKAELTIVSVGRLHQQKGFDMAIEACQALVERGINVIWHVLGEGTERAFLTQKINQYGLTARFILHGIQENPYPYVAAADIYVQPSRFEGKSIAIDEAKVLCKPIVVTRFPSVNDQITHLKNGYIADFDPKAIALAIEQVWASDKLKKQLVQNLQHERATAQDEIDKLYAVF